MARVPVTMTLYLDDDRVVARLSTEDGSSYELALAGRLVDVTPPAPPPSNAPEPTTGRKDRHVLPGAWRPQARAAEGVPAVADLARAAQAALAPPAVDHHKEL